MTADRQTDTTTARVRAEGRETPLDKKTKIYANISHKDRVLNI